MYCTAQDLIAEGVPEDVATGTRAQMLIQMASAYIEKITRRWFEPRKTTIKLDGTGHDTLWLPIPIIDIETVSVDGIPMGARWLTIYNRRMPDDRNSPRIINSFSGFPKGRQNIQIAGTFGYTDTDAEGNPITPAPIRQVCIRLVIRELPQLTDIDGQEDKKRARIQSETTDRHSYTLAQIGGGDWTGDPEVDNVLYFYSKPPGVGSV